MGASRLDIARSANFMFTSKERSAPFRPTQYTVEPSEQPSLWDFIPQMPFDAFPHWNKKCANGRGTRVWLSTATSA